MNHNYSSPGNRKPVGNRQMQSKPSQASQPLISIDVLEKIIIAGDAKTMVDEAYKLAPELVKGPDKEHLTRSQIRAIFGEVRQIQGQLSIPEIGQDPSLIQKQKEKALHKLYLLKPKMEYRARKEKGQGVQNLIAILDSALNLVFKEKDKREERFEHFVEFFEAVLSYHRGK